MGDGVYRDDMARLEALKLTFLGPRPAFRIEAIARNVWERSGEWVGSHEVTPWRIALPMKR